MSTPSVPPVPEALRLRVGPHGDPPSWIISQLSREQLVQIYRAQLEFEKATNAAHARFLENLTAAVK